MSRHGKPKKKSSPKKDAKKADARGQTAAQRADRHELYERAVQDAESEIDFVDETFETLRRRKASSLREDFAGTANTACEWIRRRNDNTAIAVDLDAQVQAWGIERHVKPLGDGAKRLEIRNDDVMAVHTPAVDIVLAHNFSYWIFKQRAELRSYFMRVREALKPDGVFFLDAYGGYEAFMEQRESTKNKGFTYIWDQAAYNPITGDMLCHIHFKFPDGSRLKRAFTYSWRLWTLPEIREILAEAGFSRSTVYWEGTDEETEEGNGEFTPSEQGEADAGWIVYLTAEP